MSDSKITSLAALRAQLSPEQQAKVVTTVITHKYKEIGEPLLVNAVDYGIMLTDAARKQFFVPKIEETKDNFTRCRLKKVSDSYDMSAIETSDVPKKFSNGNLGYAVEKTLMAELWYVECLEDIFSVEPVLNRATGEFEANKLINHKGDIVLQLELV